MFYEPPFRIAKDIWVLGLRAFPVFLIKAKSANIIIEPEIGCLIDIVEDQIKHTGISLKDIDVCIVLHEHYDHVMLVPFLYKFNSNLEIFVPEGSERILSDNLLVYKIFSSTTCDKLGIKEKEADNYNLNFKPYNENTIIEGINFVFTPGHSPFSYTAIFEDIAFVSDALGYWGKRLKFPLFFYSYSKYMESIKKIEKINPSMILTGHISYFENSKDIIHKSLELAEKTKISSKKKSKEELFNEIYRHEFLFYPEDVIRSVAKYIIKRSLEAS